MELVSATPTLDLGTELERRVAGIWWRLTQAAPSDLSRTSASVLAALREDGPQRVTTLAAREHVAQPSMSVLVQRLGQRGLVERLGDPDDRRACRIRITPAGEEILEDRARSRSRWLSSQLEHLTAEDRTTVLTALNLLDTLLTDGDPA